MLILTCLSPHCPCHFPFAVDIVKVQGTNIPTQFLHLEEQEA